MNVFVNDRVVQSAVHYAELGIQVFPTNGKVPAIENWQRRATTNIQQIMQWARGPYMSFGALCNVIGVIDTDSPELARWWRENMPETPWTVRTPRGGEHSYYKAVEGLRPAVKVNGKWDVRAGGTSFVNIAGSEVNGKLYELLGEMTLDLPLFNPEWLPKVSPSTPVSTGSSARETIEKARHYLLTAGGAVSGDGGHKKTFRLACRLVHQPPKGFGLSFAEARELMLWWNPCCSPPWSAKEIDHKLLDAIKRGSVP